MKKFLSTSNVLDKIYKVSYPYILGIDSKKISDMVNLYNSFLKHDLNVKMYLYHKLNLILEVIELPKPKGQTWYFQPIIPPVSDMIAQAFDDSIHYVINYDLSYRQVTDNFISMIIRQGRSKINYAYKSGYTPRNTSNLNKLTRLLTTKENYVICTVNDELRLSEKRWFEKVLNEQGEFL